MKKALGSEHLTRNGNPLGNAGWQLPSAHMGSCSRRLWGVKPVPREASSCEALSSVSTGGLPWWLSSKELPANARDVDSIPGSERPHMRLSR